MTITETGIIMGISPTMVAEAPVKPAAVMLSGMITAIAATTNTRTTTITISVASLLKSLIFDFTRGPYASLNSCAAWFIFRFAY